MKPADSPLTWLRTKPTLAALCEAYPDIWEELERELGEALSQRNHARLHALLQPTPEVSGKNRSLAQAQFVRSAIKQRMTALVLESRSLALATGQASGKVRFNLFNGLVAQRLLFRRGFERKPVSRFWFRLLWPLVWQKRILMPLVERKGIYCFYTRELVLRLAELIGDRSALEIAAGDGTLSRFLRTHGVEIDATDDYSWPDRIRYPADVGRMDARAALRQYAPRVVICSWPPARNTFERVVFTTPSVELYIVIASQHRFASGNWPDYENQTRFVLEPNDALGRLVLPPELGSVVLLFTRRVPPEDSVVP